MYVLLVALWMCLPIAPLNPVEEDTLAAINLHLSAGVSSPNGVTSVGPQLSASYEMLVIHPLVIRGAVDYRYGELNSRLYPNGDLHTTTFALETFYYRGTNHLTGYIGLGAVYAISGFSLSSASADSLLDEEQVVDVELAREFGYRITLGLRYRQSYSVEAGVTELRTDLIKWGRHGPGEWSRRSQPIRTGGFRLTFGYLLPLSRF
ncbi:MAG TPA: hypothetical protein VMY05_09345 [Acidobacteriota bacterium]|nr:hypothetical protein [Acidobacteriota bacterium]